MPAAYTLPQCRRTRRRANGCRDWPALAGDAYPIADHRTFHRGYQRHQPERTALYAIVEQRFPKLCAELAEQDASLPGFVTREFRDYLRCGLLEGGFVRVKCNGCRHEHLVAFSCKRRGFCPSCGARRMIETSAHLVDHVIPDVAVRQWVLSFPWPLRMLFASRPQALTRCLTVITRAIQTDLAHRAGIKASDGARTGIVTLIQRFRRLTRDGLLIPDPEQPWLDLESADTLDSLAAASVRYRIAIGPDAGRRTLTLKRPSLVRTDSLAKPLTANHNGFSLNAAVICQPHQRDRLERLCRYITRPAIGLERLSMNSAGQIVYQLKHAFRDGTTHILFSPGRLRVIADVTDPDVIRRILAHVQQRAPPQGTAMAQQHAI